MPDENKKPFDFMGLEGMAKERTEQIRLATDALVEHFRPWRARQLAEGAKALVEAGERLTNSTQREAFFVNAERLCRAAREVVDGEGD